MEFNTAMTEKNRERVTEALTELLAESYSLYLITQNFHWNVEGVGFFGAHLFFEKQYEDLADAIDEIAERIRALGFYVEATFSAFQKLTSLREENKILKPIEMVHHILLGHESVIRIARRVAKMAEEENDPATVDLAGKRLTSHEKFAWMARSQLS